MGSLGSGGNALNEEQTFDFQRVVDTHESVRGRRRYTLVFQDFRRFPDTDPIYERTRTQLPC